TVVCPHRVFSMDQHKAQLDQHDRCMECGACQQNCPANAISVDSGVGCAAAMIISALKGKKEPTCGCDDTPSCCG
ncbi:4Fe-4S ferredoxin, partial [candidate division WOR-3 bacterium]|nr:4Fe-4S ferredoxin [candidate division WOR-3 bacterium]